MHCETDPEKALKWVYESVVLPDIGEQGPNLQAQPTRAHVTVLQSCHMVSVSVLCCIHNAAWTALVHSKSKNALH